MCNTQLGHGVITKIQDNLYFVQTEDGTFPLFLHEIQPCT
jgi:hypothetical protein